MISLLAQGFLIGLSVAVPVGPIAFVCIRRAITGGILVGLAAGLGAATADALYGMVAAFGLQFVTEFLMQYKLLIHLLGSLFLCYFGYVILNDYSSRVELIAKSYGPLRAYGSTLMLTLSNPMTLFAFTAILASMTGFEGNLGRFNDSVFLVTGIFLGSVTWWSLLAVFFGMIRKQFNDRILYWINKVAGTLIMFFGLILLVSALISFFSGHTIL